MDPRLNRTGSCSKWKHAERWIGGAYHENRSLAYAKPLLSSRNNFEGVQRTATEDEPTETFYTRNAGTETSPLRSRSDTPFSASVTEEEALRMRNCESEEEGEAHVDAEEEKWIASHPVSLPPWRTSVQHDIRTKFAWASAGEEDQDTSKPLTFFRVSDSRSNAARDKEMSADIERYHRKQAKIQEWENQKRAKILKSMKKVEERLEKVERKVAKKQAEAKAELKRSLDKANKNFACSIKPSGVFSFCYGVKM